MALAPLMGLVPFPAGAGAFPAGAGAFPPGADAGGFTVIPFPDGLGVTSLDAIVLPGAAFGAIVLTKETLAGALEAEVLEAAEVGFLRAAIFAPTPTKFFLTAATLAEGALAASSLAPLGTGFVAGAGIVLAPATCGLRRVAPGEFQEFNRSH